MPLLRPRYVCFYCGRRSEQAKQPGLRKWHCQRCQADNYLDENGEITDPPTDSPSTRARPKVQYARKSLEHVPFAGTSNPTLADPDLFCPTCEKNQYMYTQTLAGYYPSGDTRGYERSEKEFRMALAKRYPLVCADCAPRAREKLRQRNRWAKADHMGRISSRLKQRKRGHPVMETLVRVGGVGWVCSWLGEVSWHLLSLYAGQSDRVLHDPRLSSCLSGILNGRVSTSCVDVSERVVGPALYLAMLSAWWNPKLRERMSRPLSRLKGAWEYYQMQVISLCVRLGLCYYITTAEDDAGIRAIHAFLLLFNLFAMVVSMRLVSIDTSPKVDFKDSSESLLHVDSQPPHNPPPSNEPQAFQINSLAPSQPPTPIPIPPTALSSATADDNDEDMMDWTPSQQRTTTTTLHPRHRKPPPTVPTGPSPFRGTLPKDVLSPAHRLRNPPSSQQPVFRAASDTQKQSFFNTTSSSSMSLSSSALDVRRKEGGEEEEGAESEVFKKQTFFPRGQGQGDREEGGSMNMREETGLEGMLAEALSIQELDLGDVRGQDNGYAVDGEGRNGSSSISSSSSSVIPVAVVSALAVAVVLGALGAQYTWATLRRER